MIVPRKKNIWIFGAWFGQRYSDNSRYVYDYVNKNEPNIRAIWLTRKKEIVEEIRKKGNEAYLISSVKGYWFCCKSGVVLVANGIVDINKLGISRAKKVQFWHGTPLKKIGFDDKITTNSNQSLVYKILRWMWIHIYPFMDDKCDLVVSPSPIISERFSTAFNVDQSKVKILGNPRGDIILNINPQSIKIFDSIKNKPRVKHIIFYLPTHRREGEKDFDLLTGLKLNKLDEFLKRNQAVLFIKMHYYHLQSTLNEKIGSKYTHIQWLEETELPDINNALPFVDILITDYSGVYFDFLLLNRPILFAPFDLESYLSKDRELYEDYDSAISGPKCRNWDEVIESLDVILQGNDQYAEKRKIASKKYNTFVDTNNCKRIVNEVKEMINNG